MPQMDLRTSGLHASVFECFPEVHLARCRQLCLLEGIGLRRMPEDSVRPR
jgi:hypothetical protein